MVGSIGNNGTDGQGNKFFGFTKFEVCTILIAVAAILVSIYSLGVGYSNSIAITDYTMQQQMLFDKQAAASQLIIEINSMNGSLQQYAHEYKNYYDFSESGRDVAIRPDMNSMFRIYDQNRTRLYEINVKHGEFSAKKLNARPVRDNGTLKMDFSDNSFILTEKTMGNKVGENAYNINFEFRQFAVMVDYPIIPSPLYNDNGMYYVYETSLSKFDKNSSQDLYLFYNNLIRAEYNRQYIQNYLDLYPNAKLNNQYFDAYMEMRIEVMYAANMVPKILKGLEREKNA
jgi:hypothetical protein